MSNSAMVNSDDTSLIPFRGQRSGQAPLYLD